MEFDNVVAANDRRKTLRDGTACGTVSAAEKKVVSAIYGREIDLTQLAIQTADGIAAHRPGG